MPAQCNVPPYVTDAHTPVRQPTLTRAPQVAFLVGLIYSAVGLLRLGWLTNFLGSSVVSGFMSGASVSIAASQVGGDGAG